jgi:hypothetical protein
VTPTTQFDERLRCGDCMNLGKLEKLPGGRYSVSYCRIRKRTCCYITGATAEEAIKRWRDWTGWGIENPRPEPGS